ncbi:hypothetical protein [Myxococcus landrumensis]|uniref:Lipoprotein n=1 Tax=Myxococcus landrumensis TaxID=2813577 RepID=A0ABX7N816_9BACT|nr:hypothetical protein [Myxococcus landrumus]QSQ12503.1 hypothetical protein JY572_29660 [Myxococcus landrumus]
MKKMLLAVLVGLCLGASAPVPAESRDEAQDEVTAETAVHLVPCCYDCGGNYDACLERCEEPGAPRSCQDTCLARFKVCHRACSYNNC